MEYASGNTTGNHIFTGDMIRYEHFAEEKRIKQLSLNSNLKRRSDESPSRRHTGNTKENNTNSQSYYTTINDFESIPTGGPSVGQQLVPHPNVFVFNGPLTDRP